MGDLEEPLDAQVAQPVGDGEEKNIWHPVPIGQDLIELTGKPITLGHRLDISQLVACIGGLRCRYDRIGKKGKRTKYYSCSTDARWPQCKIAIQWKEKPDGSIELCFLGENMQHVHVADQEVAKAGAGLSHIVKAYIKSILQTNLLTEPNVVRSAVLDAIDTGELKVIIVCVARCLVAASSWY
jgi:hypothetical protein